MEEGIFQIARKSPKFLQFIGKYLKLWWHDNIYDGVEGEEGGNGVIRFQSEVRDLIEQ